MIKTTEFNQGRRLAKILEPLLKMRQEREHWFLHTKKRLRKLEKWHNKNLKKKRQGGIMNCILVWTRIKPIPESKVSFEFQHSNHMRIFNSEKAAIEFLKIPIQDEVFTNIKMGRIKWIRRKLVTTLRKIKK